jgi:membrane protease YdiL (CAAX protease family)
MLLLEILKFKQVGFLSPVIQIGFICILLAIAIFTQRKEYKATGKTYGRYPWRISTFLSSIYEEIIFRGFILFGLLIFLSPVWSIVISSILFGLWHIKNYKWQTRTQTIHQVTYTGLIFSPITSVITLWTETIWIAVIVHYLHNLFVDGYRKLVLKCQSRK